MTSIFHAPPTTKYPLISILIPCFNHEMYLEECISSLLSQTYSNIEILFVDDCSTDLSFQIANDLSYKTSKLSVSKNPSNLGCPSTIANALSNANGDFICVIASDDFLDPNHIASCLDRINQDPLINIVFSEAILVDSNSKAIGTNCYLPQREIKSRYNINDILILGSFPAPGSFFRASALKNLDLIGYRYAEDLPMWLHALKDGGDAIVKPDPTVYYRTHSLNTHKKFKPGIVSDHLIAIQNFKKYGKHPKHIESIWLARTSRHMAMYRPILSLKYSFMAIYKNPGVSSCTNIILVLIKVFVSLFSLVRID